MIWNAPDDTKILTAGQSKLASLLLIAAFGVPALIISIPVNGVDNRVVRHQAAPPAGFHIESVGAIDASGCQIDRSRKPHPAATSSAHRTAL